MDHRDFRIGLEFWSSDRQWRCTDVGQRVVVAIRIDRVTLARLNTETGENDEREIRREEAEAMGLFSGPPYGVLESVFDEYEQEACSLQPDLD